jgi:hypothetical protein
MNGDALLFDTPVLLHENEITAEVFHLGSAPEATIRPLRKLDDNNLRSGLLTLPSGWSSNLPQRVNSSLQFFVRKGKIKVGDTTLFANAFVVVASNGVLPALSALEDSELLVIYDEGQAFEDVTDGNDARITEDVLAIEPIVPVIHGRPLTGFERRVLWLDPETGADTRLLRIPGDFYGPGANWHPVNEEIFCLEGSIKPAEDRTMNPGSYLWNPARCVHGYLEYTEGGCLLLEWHDGPWDLIKYEAPEA